MRIRKRIRRKHKRKLKNNKKFNRGRGFWDNLRKGLNNAYGYSGLY